MKVGLLIPSLEGGGAEKFVTRLADALSTYHDIYVIQYYKTSSVDKKYTQLHLGNSDGLFKQINRLKKLREIKRNYKLDVCISFLENPNIINILTKLKTCKSYISVRNYKSMQLKKGIKGIIYSLLIKVLYNYADLIITNAEKSKEDLVNNFGIAQEIIKVIYNFYNTEYINNLSNFPIEDDLIPVFQNKVIISFGRIEKVKGFIELIYAYSHARVDKNNVKLVIIGEGSLKERLQKLISELKLEQDVFLLGYKENPYKYIKNSDVFVLNSRFEGFPNALVESMICGAPVIATNCLSGPSEIIDKGNYTLPKNEFGFCEYGVLIPTPDNEGAIERLSKAMEVLLEYEDLATEYSKQSKIKTMNLDEREIISKWLEIL